MPTVFQQNHTYRLQFNALSCPLSAKNRPLFKCSNLFLYGSGDERMSKISATAINMHFLLNYDPYGERKFTK